MMQKFFALACAPLVSANCEVKTKDQILEEFRTDQKCTNDAPTSCSCLGVYPATMTIKDCNAATLLWDNPDTKQCIDVKPDADADGTKHTVEYPADYALTCDSTGFEPGSFDCTKVAGKEMLHVFEKGNENYNDDYDSAGWCADKFCWVDPCNCDKADIAESSWIDDYYYSYSMCGGADGYSQDACDKHDTKDDCDGIRTCKWTADESNGSDTDGAARVAAWLAGPAVITMALLHA